MITMYLYQDVINVSYTECLYYNARIMLMTVWLNTVGRLPVNPQQDQVHLSVYVQH